MSSNPIHSPAAVGARRTGNASDRPGTKRHPALAWTLAVAASLLAAACSSGGIDNGTVGASGSGGEGNGGT
ncbi:MAG: hypothetical protein ACK533_13410, partial [Planctomycetota bacterium]